MSEETNVNEAIEGGWSGLKKTIVGTLGTLVTAGGVWLSTFLGGNHEEPKAETPTQAAAPATAPVVINLSNNNTNQQKQSAGGTTTIIKEKVVEKPSNNDKPKEEKKKEEDPW